jgi:phosphoglycolate phosphatase
MTRRRHLPETPPVPGPNCHPSVEPRLIPSLTNVRAVLFDLDGTLLDTLEDIARSANEVLEGLGLPPHPIDAYRRFIGDGVGNLFQRAFPAGVEDAGLADRCEEGFRLVYGRGWNVASRPYPGIPELLDGLVSRGLGMAVLSNKPDLFTRQCVEEYLADWPFQAVIGNREGVPRKPDPGSALDIAGRLGVAPGQIAYLGDSSVDMTTARRAGMIPIGAAWGFRSVAELCSSGAIEVVAHPLELLALIDRPTDRAKASS